jgi:hypothetical protein
MCPFCWENVALIVAGATSTGGLAALVVKVSRKKSGTREVQLDSDEKKKQNVDEHD